MSVFDKFRFFVEAISSLQTGQDQPTAELSVDQAHHAMHVLRLGAGAEVELFDGRGRSAAGRIVLAKHGKVIVSVEGEPISQARPQPAIGLAFAVPKGKRLDWLLEKATELGVASLWPVTFERSVAGGDELGEGKRERWLAHCISAARQCGLNFLPEIRPFSDLNGIIAAVADGQMLGLAGDVSAKTIPLRDALKQHKPGQPIMILVGPEGGISPSELEAIYAGGFCGIKLGQTVLRIETAALALLAGVKVIIE